MSVKTTRCTAFILVIAMVMSLMPVSLFADETTHGSWSIVTGGDEDVAAITNIGFAYHTTKGDLSWATASGFDYVAAKSKNGKNSNGIVTTNDTSYCDFTPKKNGTLTVHIKNNTGKDGYVSRTPEGSTTGEALGSFKPGLASEVENVFKAEVGAQYSDLIVETEKGYTYYICIQGSKMNCGGAEFVPYTEVTGTINDKFNLGSYDFKFTNKTTGVQTPATVKGNTYTVVLKPGYEYSASFNGANSALYSFSTDTRNVKVAAVEDGKTQKADLTVEEATSYKVNGAVTGFDGEIPNDTKIMLVPENTSDFEVVTAEIDKTAKSYTAQVAASEKYTVVLDGAYDYELAGEFTAYSETSDNFKLDISVKKRAVYDIDGKFLGLGDVRGEYKELNVAPSEIKFTNVDDKYVYTGTAKAGSYTAKLRNGAYVAAITADGYTTSTHVVVNDDAVTRDLLLKDTSPKKVEYKDTLNVGADKEYKTIQAAVDAAAAMERPNGERVTIKITPGVYREQVTVRTPNITLTSDGGNRDNTKITWYYGIGYKYYSCVNSVYDPYADYDKFDKGDAVSYWGSAVITFKEATGFRADNITFENSFNKYMTDEEINDGAEPNGKEAIKVARKETTIVDSKTSTERAAALVNYADKTEFDKCSFIGSQDTLYTCNVNYDAYYKNCYIEGQTDFIYGNGDVIFDGCELNFCGYSETESAGYLTAQSSSAEFDAEDGYIFRNCYISYNGERKVTPGYLGRMWGVKAKVAFINSQLQEKDMIIAAGWSAMSGVEPTSPGVTLIEYNTTYNNEKVDTSKRVAGVKDTIDNSAYSVEKVFIEKGWTPAYYAAQDSTKPEFKTNPAFVSNGDINTPNPGETLTVTYALGDKWANEDASTIAWYAVDTNADLTSLETILKNAELLEVTSAVKTNKYKITMDCAGKYIMAVVTSKTLSGGVGNMTYAIAKDKPISDVWSDPEHPGSIAPGSGINIYLAGDSTVKDYSVMGIYNGGKILKEGSWGEFLQYFLDDEYVTVNNYAQGGRSLRSFLNEGKLDAILKNIKKGDYLFIQFGHNDCANDAAFYQDRFVPLYTAENPKTDAGYPTILPEESMKTATPEALKDSDGDMYYAWDCGATYKGYIQYYINKALEKGAIPVVVSPVSRLYYTSSGTIKTHHDSKATDYAPTSKLLTSGDAYVTACKEIYEANKDKGVLYIDAFNMTKSAYEDAYKAGGEAMGKAVMSDGESTHSNKTGGVIQAGMFADWIKNANISVSKYVVKPANVYGETPTGDYVFTIKNGVFTAKDSSYAENSYWTEIGQKIFDSLASKTPDIPPVEDEGKGDVTGDDKITSSDAAWIMKNKDAVLTEEQIKAADVNGDGVVDIKDAQGVLNKTRYADYNYKKAV